MGRVSTNSIYLTIEKGAHLLGGLFIMVVVARVMGAEGLAAYGFVISLTAFFAPILDLGLTNRVIRTVASGGLEAAEAVSDAIGFKLRLAPVVLVLVVGGAWIWGKSLATLIAVGLVGGSTVAMALGDSVNAIFKGLQRAAYSALLVGGLNLLLILTCLGAIYIGWGLSGIGVCYLVCRVGYFYSGLALVSSVSRGLCPSLRVDPIRASVVKTGVQFLPSAYFLGNLLHINFLTTDFADGEANSGPFFIAYRFAAALFILASGSLEAIFSGITARIAAASDIKPFLIRAFLSLFGIGFAIVAIVYVAVRPVTLWIFGGEYESAIVVIRLVVWTLPPFLLCGLAHSVLLAMKREGRGALVLTSLVCTGALLGAGMSPSWGALGTALAPSVTASLFAVILWGLVWKELRRKNTGLPSEQDMGTPA